MPALQSVCYLRRSGGSSSPYLAEDCPRQNLNTRHNPPATNAPPLFMPGFSSFQLFQLSGRVICPCVIPIHTNWNPLYAAAVSRTPSLLRGRTCVVCCRAFPVLSDPRRVIPQALPGSRTHERNLTVDVFKAVHVIVQELGCSTPIVDIDLNLQRLERCERLCMPGECLPGARAP